MIISVLIWCHALTKQHSWELEHKAKKTQDNAMQCLDKIRNIDNCVGSSIATYEPSPTWTMLVIC